MSLSSPLQSSPPYAGETVTKLTKFWVFALQHRNKWEKEAGRQFSPEELRLRAEEPWSRVEEGERRLYAIKAKLANKAAKKAGAKFRKKKKLCRRQELTKFARVENENDDYDDYYNDYDDCDSGLDDDTYSDCDDAS